MNKLAKTLLLLGTVSACERAEPDAMRRPLVDGQHRPAVGNIGQTGRPDARPGAIATPVVDSLGRPAVGNIGQAGATGARVSRRVPRPQVRAPAPPGPRLTSLTVERPLVNREERPAVGNIARKCSPCTTEEPTVAYRERVRTAEQVLLETTDVTARAAISEQLAILRARLREAELQHARPRTTP